MSCITIVRINNETKICQFSEKNGEPAKNGQMIRDFFWNNKNLNVFKQRVSELQFISKNVIETETSAEILNLIMSRNIKYLKKHEYSDADWIYLINLDDDTINVWNSVGKCSISDFIIDIV